MNADIIFCILNESWAKEVVNCSAINKQFYAISKSEVIWKRLYEYRFEMKITEKYYENYKCELEKYNDMMYRYYRGVEFDYMMERSRQEWVKRSKEKLIMK
jgi:hypothetical protein